MLVAIICKKIIQVFPEKAGNIFGSNRQPLVTDLHDKFFFVPCAGGLAAYFASLLLSSEITRQDIAVVVPWIRVKSYEASSG